MNVTCYTKEVSLIRYRDDQGPQVGVTLASLKEALSLREIPQRLEYLDAGGTLAVSLDSLNDFLYSVSPLCDMEVLVEFRRNLMVDIRRAISGELSFLSYSHGRLQDALNVLSSYLDEGDPEYPIDEVRDILYGIFCESLEAGECDPLMMTADGKPISETEAWLLALLEMTSSDIIYEIVDKRRHPADIPLILKRGLQSRVLEQVERLFEITEVFACMKF